MASTPEGRAAAVDSALAGAVNELVRKFGDRVPEDVIESTLRECFGRWPDARIRDFIPVLAQRCAHEELRQRARLASTG